MKKSFTLVEVLVSVIIMLLVVTMAASAEVFYIRTGDYVRHTTQANALAQEGLSLAELIRDNNLVQNVNSLVNFPNDNKTYSLTYSDSIKTFPTGFKSDRNPTTGIIDINKVEQITLNGVTYYRNIKISN